MFAVRTVILCAAVLAAAGPSAGDEAPLVERHFDFQGRQFDNTRLRPVVQGTVKLLQPDPKGLRVVIPAADKSDKVAVKALCVPQGDFEITASFELVRIEKPKMGFGVGPSIYIRFKSAGEDSLTLSRRARVKEGEVFTTYYAKTVRTTSEKSDKSEKGQTSDKKRNQHVRIAAAKQQTGRLRIVRSGAMLHYFVVDGPGEEFWEIDRVPTVTNDVEELWLTLERGGAPAAAEVIWKDMVVRAQSFRGEGGRPDSRMRMVVFLATLFLAVVGTGGALYWWYRRKRKASQPPAQTPPADDQAAGDQPAGKQLVSKQPLAKQSSATQPAVKPPAVKPPAAKPPVR